MFSNQIDPTAIDKLPPARQSKTGDVAISVDNVSKCHLIYDTPRDRLKQFLMPRIQSVVGKAPKAYFSEFWGLKNVSFEVKKGETVGIVGRNGAGKSTLLQIICGTLTPTSGTVETRGRVAALLELGAGFNPEFTGRENVFLNAALLGLSKEEIENRFDDVAAFADIGNFLELPVKTYSTGMSVRLAFAVQSVIDPDIFIIDEALAVGDEKFQRKCFSRLDELKSRGCSILFVSHSPTSVVELCDRALLLEQGTRLMYSTAPKTIRAYQKLIYSPEPLQQELISGYMVEDVAATTTALLATESGTSTEASVDGAYNASDEFDPGLTPETTMVYPEVGASIERICLRSRLGEVVNIVKLGEEYVVRINGTFTEDCESVYLGFHIKTISGLEITGQRFPEEGVTVPHVKRDQKFEIDFRLSMRLLPGIYFLGGGLWSTKGPTCLNRIMDASMFRVSPTREIRSFGYVNISAGDTKLRLE